MAAESEVPKQPHLSSPYGFRLQVGTRGFNLGGPIEICKKHKSVGLVAMEISWPIQIGRAVLGNFAPNQ